MNLHIELDESHPAYEWLKKQADKIGARGHFGTHLDCYTSTPSVSEFDLPVYIIDCRKGMPTMKEVLAMPSLCDKALILYTGNMYQNEYGSKAYFDETDTSIEEEVLEAVLEKTPKFILIDSYGIGKHGKHHIELDKTCEASHCYVIENIRISPEEVDDIHRVHLTIDLDYPASGKPCTVTY